MKRLEALEPITKSQRLHDRIYKEIIEPGPKYTPETADEFRSGIELFREIFMAHEEFKKDTKRYLPGDFGDMFGEYLAFTGQTSYRAGQFFTPYNVVQCVCEISIPDKEKLLGEPERFNDPAAGCGRFMVGTAEVYQKRIGMYNFLYTNIDIDFRMYVYCVMNAILYAIPSVNIHGDSLAFKFWRGTVVFKPPESPVPIWVNLAEEQVQKMADDQLEAMRLRAEENRPKTGLELYIDNLPERKPRRKIKKKKEQKTQVTIK